MPPVAEPLVVNTPAAPAVMRTDTVDDPSTVRTPLAAPVVEGVSEPDEAPLMV